MGLELLWHIDSNDKCLLVTEWLELPWLHYSKEVEIIASTILRKENTFLKCSLGILTNKGFFVTFIR